MEVGRVGKASMRHSEGPLAHEHGVSQPMLHLPHHYLTSERLQQPPHISEDSDLLGQVAPGFCGLVRQEQMERQLFRVGSDMSHAPGDPRKV